MEVFLYGLRERLSRSVRRSYQKKTFMPGLFYRSRRLRKSEGRRVHGIAYERKVSLRFLDGMKFRQGHPKPVGRGQGMAVRHPAVRPRSCSGGVSRDCFGNRCEGGTGYAGRSEAASPPLMPFLLFYSAAEPVQGERSYCRCGTGFNPVTGGSFQRPE